MRGGTAIECSEFLKHHPLDKLDNKSVEMTCEMPGYYIKDTSNVITIYRSPNGNLNQFLMVLEVTLLDVFNKNNIQIKKLLRFNIIF